MSMSTLARGLAEAAGRGASASPPSASRDRAAAPARIARPPLATRGSTVPARARPRPAAFASREDRRDAASRPRPRAKAASATAGVGSAAADDDEVVDRSVNHAADEADTRSGDSDAIEPVPSGSSATPPNGQMFVDFFRQASPYIANHRGATFVVHVPGSVMADPDRAILEGIVQDIAMLNSLGARVAVVVGSNEQVSAMCARRSVPVEVVDGYRVTTPESLEIAMEAAGRNDVLVQALLSRGVNVAVTRKHGDSARPAGRGGGGGYAFEDTVRGYGSDIDVMSRDRFGSNANAGRPGGGASATSGNFITAKRRGIVRGVDFQYTGDVVYVDVDAVAQRLRFGDVVLLSSLGFNAAGEVLNCQSYDVAVSLAVDVAADKLISYVAPGDMPVGEDGARAKYMPLSAAQAYISRLASRGLEGLEGLETTKDAEEASPSMPEQWRWLDREGDDEVRGALAEKGRGGNGGNGSGNGNEKNAFSSPWRRLAEKGLQWRVDGCPQEISAAVFSCKAGVRRAHLIDYTVPGALLLELYTLDGVGAMVSRDRYEGTRCARPEDWTHIKSILEPLAKQGVTVAHGSDDELIEEVTSGAFAVTERDGKIIACAALRRYKTVETRDEETTTENRDSPNDDVIGEIAAFAVRPGYRNEGRGDALLEYLEREARRENIQTLFLLTTRTADWFTARGFAHAGAADTSPLLPPGKKTMPGRNSQLYVRSLNDA
jgi:amino-acid N-acetyltransferase